MATSRKVRLPFTPEQRAVFFESKAKFRIVAKGGRVGLTLGATLAFIVYAMQGKKKALWGDTTHGNILLYWEDFEKVLKIVFGEQGEEWQIWRERGIARILGMTIHFRYAQNPKNWEGQSYEVIFLNEAGVILDGDYIWKQVVLKSVMQYPDAFVVAAGVPKGVNQFSKLIEVAKEDTTGRYEYFQFSSYTNPFTLVAEIEQMERDMGDMAAQEVHGEVIDGSAGAMQYIPADWVNQAFDRFDSMQDRPEGLSHAALDPSLGGDTCVFGWKYNNCIPKMSSHTGAVVNDPGKVAAKFLAEVQERMRKSNLPDFKFTEHLKRVEIALDFQGPGSGVFSAIGHQLASMQGINIGAGFDAPKFMEKQYPNIIKIYSSNKGDQWSYDKQWRLVGERIQMLDKVKAALDPTSKNPLAIERDPQLRREITAYCYEIMDGNRIRLELKDETKKRIGGKSPGKGDVLMYLLSGKGKSTYRTSVW